MIFLATVFIQKRHPYTKGLLSIEQNCSIARHDLSGVQYH